MTQGTQEEFETYDGVQATKEENQNGCKHSNVGVFCTRPYSKVELLKEGEEGSEEEESYYDITLPEYDKSKNYCKKEDGNDNKPLDLDSLDKEESLTWNGLWEGLYCKQQLTEKQIQSLQETNSRDVALAGSLAPVAALGGAPQ